VGCKKNLKVQFMKTTRRKKKIFEKCQKKIQEFYKKNPKTLMIKTYKRDTF